MEAQTREFDVTSKQMEAVMQEEKAISQCADTLSTLACTKSAEPRAFGSNLLAVAISKGETADQLNVLGNFIVGVGGLILTIASYKFVNRKKTN